MKLCCEQDDRREAVRSMKGRNGIDFVELGPYTRTLHVYFLGKLPPVLLKAGEKAGEYFRIDGGRRVRDLRILKATPVPDDNPEKDDFLILELDRAGEEEEAGRDERLLHRCAQLGDVVGVRGVLTGEAGRVHARGAAEAWHHEA